MNTHGSKTEPKAAPMKASQNRSKEHASHIMVQNGLHSRARISLQNQARVVITITLACAPVQIVIIYISLSFGPSINHYSFTTHSQNCPRFLSQA